MRSWRTYPDEARSERHAQGEPHRQRFHWFEMDVVDGRRLARQLRGVEIVDLVGARIVEQVENVEPEPRLLGKFVAKPQIEERRGFRSHAVVLDQRPPAKIAEPQRAEPGTEILDGGARGGDQVGRAGD